MQMPNIQPADVFTPITQAGEKLSSAAKNLGKGIDTYQMMQRIMESREGRAETRKRLLEGAGLTDDDLPKEMTSEQLADFATRIKTIRAIIPEIQQYKVPSFPERKLVSMAAGTSKQGWDKLISTIQKEVDAKKKGGEATAEGARLQDVSAGLRTEPIDMQTEMPDVAQPGTFEPSQQLEDVGAGTRVAGETPGAVTKEGALQAAGAAGIDWTKTTPEQRTAFEGQYLGGKDIMNAEARKASANKPKTAAPSKPLDIKKYLNSVQDDIKSTAKDIDRLRVAQAKLTKTGTSAVEAAILAEIGGNETDTDEVIAQRLHSSITSKKKMINDFITDYNEYAAPNRKKEHWGIADSGKAPAKTVAPAAGGGDIEAAMKAAYSQNPKPGQTYEQYRAKAMELGKWDGILSNFRNSTGK